MKKHFIGFLFLSLVFAFQTQAQQVINWEVNFQEALKKAKKEKKTLLLNFTGSDWCGWCIRLDNEVFSQKSFVDYANKNLVMVKLDFPRKKQLSAEETVQNRQLAQKYDIKGFPTILLLDPSENTILQTGYQRGGPDSYVQHLSDAIQKFRQKSN